MSDSICVITPCFNAAPFLLSCLRSVAAQDSVVSKHIVMDGGSTDGSVRLLQDFARTHAHVEWRSERDSGQSDALNKALTRVNTPYFAWLNADDCLLPGKIGVLLRATRLAPSPTIVYGDYQVIDADGALKKRRVQPSFNYWDCLYSYLTVQNCAALFQTDACRRSGGFDPNLQFCMDYDLVLRLAGQGVVRHVRDYIGCFRHHDASKTSQLQEVCAIETQRLRRHVSGRSSGTLRLRYWVGSMRVAARMLAEGCMGSRLNLGSRLGLSRLRDVTQCSPD